MRAGLGYGYNCAVVFDPPMAGLSDGRGEYFWDGAAGTWFWVDPTNDVVFVGMIQRMLGPASPNVEYLSRATIIWGVGGAEEIEAELRTQRSNEVTKKRQR